MRTHRRVYVERQGSPYEEASESVPFTAEEEAQADRDEAAALIALKAEETAAAERTALVEKLGAGDASPAELQQALASLLA